MKEISITKNSGEYIVKNAPAGATLSEICQLIAEAESTKETA